MKLKNPFSNQKHQMNLFEIIDIDRLKEQYSMPLFQLIDFSASYDDCIYLLFAEDISDGTDDMFSDNKAKTTYKGICIKLDWEKTVVEDVQCYDLGRREFNYHFFRPFKEGFLLLGARCEKEEDNAENNALFIRRDGHVIKEFCLGDGIQDCITTIDGKIILSYFDEGIFGNYGWDFPLGSSGLVVWNEFGNIVWENRKYDIADCYAMNVDSLDRLWFYYYTNFDLVCTDYKSDFTVNPKVSGSSAFAISKKRRQIIMEGGYNDGNFYIYKFDEDENKIGDRQSVIFALNQWEVFATEYKFFKSNLLFITSNNILCGYYFI